jgi:hypothetical protein
MGGKPGGRRKAGVQLLTVHKYNATNWGSMDSGLCALPAISPTAKFYGHPRPWPYANDASNKLLEHEAKRPHCRSPESPQLMLAFPRAFNKLNAVAHNLTGQNLLY